MNTIVMKNMLMTATDLIIESVPYLTELDSATGDGDHGITMNKIAKKINECCVGLSEDENLESVLEDLSWELMNISGGSAGPLWGSFFEGMAKGAGMEADTEVESFKYIFVEAYKNFLEVSGAKAGEKTMMDAIYPATLILEKAEKVSSLSEISEQMAKAAMDGAEDTKNMLAKFGRARSLKEKSIGHKDPGAVSFSLFYKGVAEGLNV